MDLQLINREQSLLAFNERVLAQCELPEVPVLEQLKYLTIVSSNLDEFFEVRLAALKDRLAELRLSNDPFASELHVMLVDVAGHAHTFVARQYACLNEKILPTLREAGIDLVREEDLTAAHKRWMKSIFQREIAPLLTPIGLDPAHPFPAVANKGLHYIVELRSRRDAKVRRIAIVKVPRTLPRIFEMTAKVKTGSNREFVLLSSLIEAELKSLFPGREVLSYSQFRVTRDSDLWVDEEETTNLRHALQGELRRRPFGRAVRLEINANCSERLVRMLAEHFELEAHEIFRVDGPVNLSRLMALADLVDAPELRFPAFRPGVSKPVLNDEDVFAQLKKSDRLLHHPYQSFEPVIQFLRCAVNDPDVVAIKQTIYRTGSKSTLMELLLEAVRLGKEVTVVLELKARFDEEININWADKLEQAGAHVVFGVVGLKTHAKMALIFRREGKHKRTICNYAHIGTGNYNPSTARFYTDFGLLTANPALTKEVAAVFHHLTSLSRPPKLKHLWWAPHSMKQNLLHAIANETKNAKSGEPARIMARVNALTDEIVIAALYEASNAGVQIDLIVRGACCLRPGVAGLSENIRVRSVIGRFLEHSRVYYFENGGDADLYISSADWMSRNLDRRIEVGTPIFDPELKARVLEEGLLIYLQDNKQAWHLHSDGAYRMQQPSGRKKSIAAQKVLAEKWGELHEIK